MEWIRLMAHMLTPYQTIAIDPDAIYTARAIFEAVVHHDTLHILTVCNQITMPMHTQREREIKGNELVTWHIALE